MRVESEKLTTFQAKAFPIRLKDSSNEFFTKKDKENEKVGLPHRNTSSQKHFLTETLPHRNTSSQKRFLTALQDQMAANDSHTNEDVL